MTNTTGASPRAPLTSAERAALHDLIVRLSGPQTRNGEWPDAEVWMAQGIGQSTAKYLAAASLSTILSLLDENEELRAAIHSPILPRGARSNAPSSAYGGSPQSIKWIRTGVLQEAPAEEAS